MFKPLQMGATIFSQYCARVMQEIMLEEAHPLAVQLSFSISLGLLPVTFSLKTAGCGIQNSGLPEEEAGDLESSSKSTHSDGLFINCSVFHYDVFGLLDFINYVM